MCTETFLRLPEEKRQRILTAAWAEFTRVSFAEVSINQIIRQAGIPRGSFYQYFADKADLFTYLLTTLREQLFQLLEELLDRARGDLFQVQLMAYDGFAAHWDAPPPPLDRFEQIIRLNVGMDLKKILTKPLEGSQVLEHLLSKLDAAALQRQDPAFVRRVFSMSTMLTASTMMDSLCHPERLLENRRELEARLKIIKYGSLAACGQAAEKEVLYR